LNLEPHTLTAYVPAPDLAAPHPLAGSFPFLWPSQLIGARKGLSHGAIVREQEPVFSTDQRSAKTGFSWAPFGEGKRRTRF